MIESPIEFAYFQVDLDQQLSIADFRALIKHRAGGLCERCGQYRKPPRRGKKARMEAHHRDHNHSNNTLRNGEWLCDLCHEDEHRKPKPERARLGSPEAHAKRLETETARGLSRSEICTRGWQTRRAKREGVRSHY